jgi:hypothetical protein
VLKIGGMAREKRTDIHRPGAIVPSAYGYLLSYDMGGPNEPAWNLDAVRAMRAAHPEAPVFGACGKCGVCGASYRYGDLWKHENGDLLHIGHDCADKYEMLANRPEFNAQLEVLKRGRAARIAAEKNKRARANFDALYPGVSEAIEANVDAHPILRDLLFKLNRYHSLSHAQVGLAQKLVREAGERSRGRAERDGEAKVSAPISDERIKFQGTIVAKKNVDSMYGPQVKIGVKVTTPAGYWMAWGTCPSQLLDTDGGVAVGDQVELTAKLAPGNEAHFAFMNRPHGRIVRKAEARASA